MSLILEALKKSERERVGQATSLPSMVRPRHILMSPRARRRHQSRILIVIVALLIIATPLLWLLFGGQDHAAVDEQLQTSDMTAIQPQASAVPTQVSSANAVSPPWLAVMPSVDLANTSDKRSQSRANTINPVSASNQSTTAQINRSDVQTVPPVAELPVVAEAVQLSSLQHEDEHQQADVIASSTRLRTFRQLPSAMRARLKPLHLDVHVYGRSEERRFVYINGRLYGEGATLKNGAELLEIVPAGAVMMINGEQFLLTVND